MATNPVINIVISQGSDFEETFKSTESDGSVTNLAGSVNTGGDALSSTSGSSSVMSADEDISTTGEDLVGDDVSEGNVKL